MIFSPPKCPKCKYQLTWRNLRGRFECPGCRIGLESNYVAVLVFVIVIPGLAFTLYVPSDTLWTILLGGALLIALTVWILAKFVYVRLAREPNAT